MYVQKQLQTLFYPTHHPHWCQGEKTDLLCGLSFYPHSSSSLGDELDSMIVNYWVTCLVVDLQARKLSDLQARKHHI